MDCSETRRLLDAYVDGELELIGKLDVEAHLAACSTCKKAAVAAIHFCYSVGMNMPVYKAPPELKATIRAALRKESGSRLEWISQFWRHFALAAAILVLSLLLAWVWIAVAHGRDRALIDQAISNHSRSLLVDHLLDVTSSNQHIVNPWFTGKLDYSPPVADLSEAGFNLIGGRIDLLGNRSVAAIVHQHQGHFINVFVWPAASRSWGIR
jgi:anti-sigma factor RsiW